MKRNLRRIVLAGGLLLPLAALVGPFLVPIPPLEGTHPPQSLADPDSQFLTIDGLSVHVKSMGQGEPAIVLLHGFGASLYSWQAVMEPLSRLGRVIAYDRPAFGLTGRPLTWQGQNPYGAEAQVEMLFGLLDQLGARQAILVGHSAGGTVAMQAALAHPDRVRALILAAPAVSNGGGAPAWLHPFIATPQMRRLGPLLVRQIQRRGPELIRLAWHDPAQADPQMLALYQKPLQVENWDRALWEYTQASRPAGLERRLDEFRLPILVITGDDDRIVPTADSLRLAKELPGAELAVISRAGHVVHEEQPQDFLEAVSGFLSHLRP